MKAKKILFISQEIIPYVAESELSQLGRYLPQAIQEKGRDIRTFMPKWGNINERRNQLHEVIRLSGMNLIIDDTDHPLIIKVASIQAARLQIYFIDNDDYFMKRGQEADDKGEEYTDNGERAVFFARGVLETVKKLRWCPDIILCQGWMSAVVPLYIKTAYKDEPSFRDTRVIYSLFGNDLKKPMGENLLDCLECKELTKEQLSDYNQLFTFDDLNKMAIDYSDGVIEAGTGVKPEYVEYAKSKNIPFMKPDAIDDYAAYNEFFNQFGTDEEEEEEQE